MKIAKREVLNTPIGAEMAAEAVGMVSGVKPTDTRLEAARKTVETMEKFFGVSHPRVRRARKLYEEAKAKAQGSFN